MWREPRREVLVQGSSLAVFGHALDVLEGHPSRGMAGLAEVRQRQEVLGNSEVVHTIDAFTANVRARLATGLRGGTRVSRRHP